MAVLYFSMSGAVCVVPDSGGTEWGCCSVQGQCGPRGSARPSHPQTEGQPQRSHPHRHQEEVCTYLPASNKDDNFKSARTTSFKRADSTFLREHNQCNIFSLN